MKQVAISDQDIQSAVKSLADRINEDYKDKQVVFVGVLNGCFMFFSDLIKQITLDCEVDFISVKSYEGKRSIQLEILKDLKLKVEGKIVIMVDEIIDTGETKKAVNYMMLSRGAEEVKWCFLLQRSFQENKEDYVGVKVNPEWWCFGYGLDDNEKNRNLTQIYYNT